LSCALDDNAEKSLEFYEGVMGMKVLRHEEFNQGCEATCNGPYARPWSKTMVGYGSEQHHFVFELTYNYGIKSYKRGNDLRHVEVRLPMTWMAPLGHLGVNGVYTLHDPDGYIWHVSTDSYKPHVSKISLHATHMSQAKNFYHAQLGMAIIKEDKHFIQLAWSESDRTVLELVKSEEIRHEDAFGRIAMAWKGSLEPIAEKIRSSGHTIKHGPITLDTPGKASVQVVIILDSDSNEICLVEETGFDELSAPKDGADVIDWEARAELGADQ
jgi:catechol 2,3-dioxygenase-like lactoylglutathione lyase family enzyme